MSELDEVVQEFLTESNENLDHLDREFVELERDPSRLDLLASIFRTIHTIKGTCGFLGYSNLEQVAHAGETLLSKLRDGVLTYDGAIADMLLAMVDAVRTMLSQVASTGGDGQDPYDELKRLLLAQGPRADLDDDEAHRSALRSLAPIPGYDFERSAAMAFGAAASEAAAVPDGAAIPPQPDRPSLELIEAFQCEARDLLSV